MLGLVIAAALAAAPIPYVATVVRVVDGDTIKVTIAGWPEPFTPIDVRVAGIDTPEKSKPPAKSACEVVLGKESQAFARQLLHPGDQVVVTYQPGKRDKYARLLASVSMPDGRDFAGVMIATGKARPYDGGAKSTWCAGGKPTGP